MDSSRATVAYHIGVIRSIPPQCDLRHKTKARRSDPLHWAIKSPLRTRVSLNLEHRNKKVNEIHEGKWNDLGGKVEAGETPAECVIREVYEESGFSICNPKLCGLLMFPRFKGNDWYVFVFTANNFSGEMIDSPEGRVEWDPDETILDLNLWQSDHIFMPWIQEGKFFSAEFEYEGDEKSDTMWFSIPQSSNEFLKFFKSLTTKKQLP